jgi:hypothetical protein
MELMAEFKLVGNWNYSATLGLLVPAEPMHALAQLWDAQILTVNMSSH